MKIVVIGAGSWGTAMAKVFADAGNSVQLWVRNSQLSDSINRARRNSMYLPHSYLPDNITAFTGELAGCDFTDVDVVAIAIPSQKVRELLARTPHISDATVIVSLMKGIETASLLRMSQVLKNIWDTPNIAVLSGPNLAVEVSRELPTGAVLAHEDYAQSVSLSSVLQTDYFFIEPSEDLLGLEIAGSAKNVIALACGLAHGLEYGDNTQSAIITAGFQEISQLSQKMGADMRTMFGLAGLGDLLATCSSPLSRNRTYGVRLAYELSARAESTVRIGGVAQLVESVPTVDALRQLARDHTVNVPIIDTISDVVHHRISPTEAIARIVACSVGGNRPLL